MSSTINLFIHIPFFNEEATIKSTLKATPKKIEGIDGAFIAVIDDEKADNIIKIAKENKNEKNKYFDRRK